MSDRHVRRSGADYAQAFLALLPQGYAWPRDPDSLLVRAVQGFCAYWGFVDSRAADLLERESDPRLTIELLPDWERNWGLPDPCIQTPSTIAERQIALVAKMTLLGGQSRAFFVEVLNSLGYNVTISSIREHSPYMCGISRIGDTTAQGDGVHPRWELGPAEIRYYWSYAVTDAKLSWFRCGSGQCGVDPMLRIGLATDIECLLERYKPAHTMIVFDYSNLGNGDSMAGTP